MIHFIAAGPGAVDLITVRAQKLLKAADVVIYAGSLINHELLRITTNVLLYDSSNMTLDEIIAVMDKKRNKNVVRLHSGDPSLYGALREQIDRLKELSIDFDITPGVSSFCAAAASLKTGLTLPGVSQSVVITRTCGRTFVPSCFTTVLFLSAGYGARAQELLLREYGKDTPAAIVYKASLPEELIVRTTVGEIAQSLIKNNIDNHALIIAGDVLGSDYELSRLYAADFETGYREASQ